MNNILMSVVLLLIWLRLRVERRRNDTEWFCCITDTRRELNERIAQAESNAESALSLQNSRGATIERRNVEIEILKRQLANRNGQITKLKKKIGGVK